MDTGLPPLFIERLRHIVPEENFSCVMSSFMSEPVLSLRINTLKTDRKEIIALLKEKKIAFQDVDWNPAAWVLESPEALNLLETSYFDKGCLYRQSLASMLPALVLNPLPGERVCDLCAAPGSKTTQMAALMQNQGSIVAVEAIRSRFYKLKNVALRLGAENVSFYCLDARRYRTSGEAFDKVLVDVPCSSEGRFHIRAPKTYSYWSLRKIREMVRKQRGILLAAGRLLKPGGILVYSTCTFAPEENEGVLDWFLRKTDRNFQIQAIDLPSVATYPCLETWQKRDFDARLTQCCRVLPTRFMTGFFLAKLVRTA